jgi:putative FmdB family regulatory protein
MPIYNYECKLCDIVYEFTASMTDSTERVCAECGDPLKKVFSAPVINFKGDGWGKDA